MGWEARFFDTAHMAGFHPLLTSPIKGEGHERRGAKKPSPFEGEGWEKVKRLNRHDLCHEATSITRGRDAISFTAP